MMDVYTPYRTHATEMILYNVCIQIQYLYNISICLILNTLFILIICIYYIYI